MDLRHMTSAGALHAPSTSSRRVSQKVGSRSPASIPSSPTSVHSSSSAIFERDIEPIVAPSPSQLLHTASATSHLQNPHRIPRVKLEEQSVPSVLDSAAEILAGLQDEGDQMQVAVEAPAVSMFTDGGKSPMSYRSRSPSPGLASGPGAGSLLLSIPVSTSPTVPHQTTSPPRPTISTNVSKQQQQQQHDAPPSTQTPASISAATPTSAYFSTTSSVASGSAENSPKTTTREKGPELPDSPDRDALISPAIPNAPPPSAIEAGHGSSFSPSLFTFNATTSPPRSVAASSSPSQSMPSSPRQPNQTLSSSSPTSHSQKVAKRLSFMSYNDLLTSTPLSTVPLSSLTNSVEPPPHIPPVAGYPVSDYPHTHAGSNAPSIKGSPGVITSVKEREMLDDLGLVGGEWEREGLGRGLEERLEAIVGMGSPGVVGHA
ncbi:hypothetical protein L218DRAFT_940029 [Marasmius fiardii PR-910]|nr:hypothetical protein L218DRAFT_940029 [Marasmius fiardii PR-910]